jgi:hypothetical protein
MIYIYIHIYIIILYVLMVCKHTKPCRQTKTIYIYEELILWHTPKKKAIAKQHLLDSGTLQRSNVALNIPLKWSLQWENQ